MPQASHTRTRTRIWATVCTPPEREREWREKLTGFIPHSFKSHACGRGSGQLLVVCCLLVFTPCFSFFRGNYSKLYTRRASNWNSSNECAHSVPPVRVLVLCLCVSVYNNKNSNYFSFGRLVAVPALGLTYSLPKGLFTHTQTRAAPVDTRQRERDEAEEEKNKMEAPSQPDER